MTEADWLTCTDPAPMLEYLRGRAGDRKLRLFAVACCRRVWHRMADKCSRRAVEVAERYADGLATPQTLLKWHWAALEAYELADGGERLQAAYAAGCAVHEDATFAALNVSVAAPTGHTSASDWREGACDLLREIFGTPFYSVIIEPSWRTWHGGLLVSMARRMYESRDFSDVPVLADALEEAGCEDADILGHCRQAWEHVRGCWVVDLVLGKQQPISSTEGHSQDTLGNDSAFVRTEVDEAALHRGTRYTVRP
jgi:hypothetical protein